MSFCRLFLFFFSAIIFSYLPAELLLCGAEELYGVYHVIKNRCVLSPYSTSVDILLKNIFYDLDFTFFYNQSLIFEPIS